MNIDTLISIVMPAYNSEKHIKKAIKSVINQSYSNWELLVIDDGSTDSTKSIIDKFAKADHRIKPQQNKENLGVSKTRNKGIELSKGEWIAFLDSDDMWNCLKLEKQIKLARINSAEFIFTGASYINEVGSQYPGEFSVPETVNYKELRNHNVISCSSVIVKRKHFSKIKMENDSMHEDYAVWLRILESGVIAYGLDEPLLRYRLSKDSKSGNKFKTVFMTYSVFRFIGFSPIKSSYFMTRHVLASLIKYNKIFRG